MLLSRFFLFLSLCFLFACSKDEPAPLPPVNDPTQVDYLALGDSYTIGERVAVAERFPVQLADSLQDRGFIVPDPTIIATTGWTTANLQAAIDAANLTGTYDLVSLLIGVNNQFQGRSLTEYRQQYTQLLDRAIELAGGENERVIVLSIPDYAFTPFGQNSGNAAAISAGIDAFNAAKREITEARGIAFYDITPISRQGLAEPSLVASDGLHPSGEQYRRWVAQIVADVADKLE